jgi:tRNA G26 N,N-dimethylase Trm1
MSKLTDETVRHYWQTRAEKAEHSEMQLRAELDAIRDQLATIHRVEIRPHYTWRTVRDRLHLFIGGKSVCQTVDLEQSRRQQGIYLRCRTCARKSTARGIRDALSAKR